MTKAVSDGAVHKVPSDLRKVLMRNTAVLAAWEEITPLARNEWVCWVTSAKQDETRARRIKRTAEQLEAGKRRPCCWAGCLHRQKTARRAVRQQSA